MKFSFLLALCLFSGTTLFAAENISVPILLKIKNNKVKFRTTGAGFTQDKEKLVWAFEIDSFQELQKKDNLLFGYYSDLDNDPKTGMPPWDLMFNIRMKQNKLEVLSLNKGKYKSYPLYPDDYVIQVQENMLYIVLRKGCIRDKVFGEKFTMRFTSYHTKTQMDKDGTLPKYWPDVKVNTKKPLGVFAPALKFNGFLSKSSRLQKERYCALIGKAGAYSVWESFGERFEEKEAMPPVIAKKNALEIRGAKGEWEGVHFAVTAGKPFDSFRVIPGKLVNASGKEFPASALTIYYPAYATDAFGKIITDPLLPAYRKSSSRNHFAVIDAKIPRDMEKGIYKGKIQLEINGKIRKEEIPLEITVYGFSLPEVRTLKTAMHVHPGYIGGGKEGYELMHKWGFSTQYPSINGVINWGPAPNKKPGNGAIWDFERYSKACDEFFLKNKASVCVSVTFMRGSHDIYARNQWSNKGRKEPSVIPPETEKLIAKTAVEMETFLKKKGLLDKFIFILWDEPYAAVYESIRETAAIIKKAAPGLKMGIYIDNMHEILAQDGNIDVWMFTFPQALQKTWKNGKKNNRFWLYNTLGMGSLETPCTVPRMNGHFAFLYDIDGYLCWCINMIKPVKLKQGVYQLSSTSYSWYYPDPAQKKVYPSLRLMMAREGMDDYEYFSLHAAKQGKNWKNILKKHCVLDPASGSILYKAKNNFALQKFRDSIGKKLENTK